MFSNKFRHDHRSWMAGYRDARNRTYRIAPFLDSTHRHLELFRQVNVWAYAAGYLEGEDALMRDTDDRA
jgi:hypothetical protein